MARQRPGLNRKHYPIDRDRQSATQSEAMDSELEDHDDGESTASSHRHPRDHRVSEQFRPQGVENNRHPYPKPHPQRFQTITYKMAKSKTQQEKEALEQRIAQLESQNAQLKQQKTEAATYTELVPRLGKKKNDENVKVLKKVIKKILKVKFWRNLKFFPRKRKDEIMIGTKIIMAISDQLPDWQAMSKNQKQQFIVESLPLTASVLNDHWNYVIARIKDSAKLWWDDHKQKLPSVAKIVACMKREIDPSKPADYELMKWYWDDILVKAVGNGTDWAPAVRHYSTISKAAPEDDPNHLYVTEATEAFAVVTYDNCRDAWVEQFKLKDAHGSKTKLQFAQAPEGEDAEFKKEEDKVWMYSPKFHSKWTNMEAGSSRHGGFKREGQDQYKKYRKEVAKVRKDPAKQEVEEQFLAALRKSLKITMPSAALTKAEKKRKREEDEEDEDDDDGLFEEGDFSDVEELE